MPSNISTRLGVPFLCATLPLPATGAGIELSVSVEVKLSAHIHDLGCG